MSSILPDAYPMNTSLTSWENCLLCGGDAPAPICQPCTAELTTLSSGCPRCAEAGSGTCLCGRCLQHPPAFDRTIALFAYAFPLDQLLHALKYQHQLLLARWLGRQLATRCGTLQPDAVLPLPLHPVRLAERGFNQALEIARPVATALAAPLRANLCQRTRATPAQADLPLSERAANVRNAFSCEERLDGQHIVVVDDVMTTGATLHECAKVLKRQGAREVSALIVARALKHGQEDVQ